MGKNSMYLSFGLEPLMLAGYQSSGGASCHQFDTGREGQLIYYTSYPKRHNMKYPLITPKSAHLIHKKYILIFLLHVSASFTPSSGSFTPDFETYWNIVGA
jgi:hypothetical protein